MESCAGIWDPEGYVDQSAAGPSRLKTLSADCVFDGRRSKQKVLVESNAEAVSDHIAKVESNMDLATEDVVAGIWAKTWWIGKVINLSVINDDAEIRFKHPVGESRLLYRWPDIPDELLVK